MKKFRGSAILMIVAILVITGFQVYWLKNNYDREKQNLDIRTASYFRQTVLKLQSKKMRLESISLNIDSIKTSDVILSRGRPRKGSVKLQQDSQNAAISLLTLLQEKLRDSLKMQKPSVTFLKERIDTLQKQIQTNNRRITVSDNIDSLLPPAMIREVRIKKGENNNTTIIVGVNKKTGRPKKNDSVFFHERTGEDYFIDNGITVPDNEFSESQFPGKRNKVFRLLYDMDSLTLKDSVTVKEVDSAYAKKLKEEKINVGFKISRSKDEKDSPNTVTIGFSKPTTFSYTLTNTFGYLFSKLKLPLLFSLLLLALTIGSFVLLYRNMMKQKRLADLKNEFISNITHELKTPIATVGVAIEALKNFNAIQDPNRTEEYLTISQNELQRLNLLVDKVLKLSMFENKEIDLKYEPLNLSDIVDEVVASMRLQVEKYKATVSVNTEGDCNLQGDKLHLLSVVFNLLDNALKYGGENPRIQISMEEKENVIELIVADNGIGIPLEYKGKVFDKFFRVPHGDTHNAKGYGLGLSYVAHVINKHKGTIIVESETGKGSTFVINLPKQHK